MTINISNSHTPVMVSEVIEYLDLGAHLNKAVIDATLGYAGHTRAIMSTGSKVLGIEYDPQTLTESRSLLTPEETKSGSVYVQGNFCNIDQIARENGFLDVDAVLFDLGVNSVQLTSKSRGLSFTNPDAPLDMRLDRSSESVKASDLLNGLREDQLVELFREFEIDGSRLLSRLIVDRRQHKKFEKVSDLLEIVDKLPKRNSKIKPATTVFMALRISVNSEIENLKSALPKAFGILKPRGRLVVISFHSGEDRIVKEFTKEQVMLGRAKNLTKKPKKPSETEITINPRSRSARLRAIEKI